MEDNGNKAVHSLRTNFEILFSHTTQGKTEDTGEPLILTDHLSNGNDAEARRLARVNSQYFLDVVSYSGKCNFL